MKFVLTFLLGSCLLFSQNAGKSGLSFLKMPADARVAALGETGLSTAQGPMALFYNSGNLGNDGITSVAFMHNQWLESIKSEVFSARVNLFGLPFAVGINSVTVPDIEIRTKAGASEGTFNAHFTSVNLGTAYSITNEITAGVTVKNLFENIYADDANGWAADLYGTYTGFYKGLAVSLGLKNLGSMNNLRYSQTELPSSFAIGAGLSPRELGSDITIAPAAEVQSFFNGGTKINFGSEFSFRKMISLRAGYSVAESLRKVSFGIGLNYDFVSFNYALLPAAEDFSTGHLISLQIDF